MRFHCVINHATRAVRFVTIETFRFYFLRRGRLGRRDFLIREFTQRRRRKRHL